MKLSSLLLCASAAVAIAAKPSANATSDIASVEEIPELLTFSEWKALFNKEYADEATELEAQQAFAKTVAFIKQHNSEEEEGKHRFRCGVNQVGGEWFALSLISLRIDVSISFRFVVFTLLLSLIVFHFHRRPPVSFLCSSQTSPRKLSQSNTCNP